MDEWCFYIEPHLSSQSLVRCLQSSVCIGQWMDKATADVLERLELKNARVVDHSLSQMDEMHKDPQVLLRSRFFRFETDSVRNKLQKQICYCPQVPSLSSDHRPFLHKKGVIPTNTTKTQNDPFVSSTAWKREQTKKNQGSFEWTRILTTKLMGLCALHVEEDKIAAVPHSILSRVQAISVSGFCAPDNLHLFAHLYTLHLHHCTQLPILPKVHALILDSCHFQEKLFLYYSMANAKFYLDMTNQIWESAKIPPLRCKTLCLHSCDDRSDVPNPQAFLHVTKFVASHCHIERYDLPEIVEYKSIQCVECARLEGGPHLHLEVPPRRRLGPHLHSFTYEINEREANFHSRILSIGNHAVRVVIRGYNPLHKFMVMPSFPQCTHLTLDSLADCSIHNLRGLLLPIPNLEECHIRNCRILKEIPGFLHCKVMYIENCPALQPRPSFIGQAMYVDSVLLPSDHLEDIHPVAMENHRPEQDHAVLWWWYGG